MTGVIGLFIFIPSFYKKLVCRNKTTATVVHIIEIQKVSSHTSHTKYSPIFSYNANGKDITAQGNSSGAYHLIGDTFPLFYDEEKPERHYFGGKFSLNNIMIILGLVLILIATLKLTPVLLSILKAIPK